MLFSSAWSKFTFCVFNPIPVPLKPSSEQKLRNHLMSVKNFELNQRQNYFIKIQNCMINCNNIIDGTINFFNELKFILMNYEKITMSKIIILSQQQCILLHVRANIVQMMNLELDLRYWPQCQNLSWPPLTTNMSQVWSMTPSNSANTMRPSLNNCIYY